MAPWEWQQVPVVFFFANFSCFCLCLLFHFHFSLPLYWHFELFRSQEFKPCHSCTTAGYYFLDFLRLQWGTPSSTAPLFTLVNICWRSGAPDYPLPTSRRFQRSYGGDGEAIDYAIYFLLLRQKKSVFYLFTFLTCFGIDSPATKYGIQTNPI